MKNPAPRSLLTFVLLGLNLITALWGIVFPEVYNDPITSTDGWNRATLLAVDAVSLCAFACMALLAHATHRGPRWNALWLGAWLFSAYAHAFQVFTTALNAKYPLHVAGFVIGAWGSVYAVHVITPGNDIKCGPKTKAASVWMILVSLCLVGVWTAGWREQLVSGFANTRQNDLIRSIAALDLLMVLPSFVWVGFGLWRGKFHDSPLPTALNLAFGIFMAALAVACLTQRAAGISGALGELPQWTLLAVCSLACAALTLPARSASDQRRS